MTLGTSTLSALEPTGGTALSRAEPTIQVVSKDPKRILNQTLGASDHSSIVAQIGQAFVVTVQYPLELAASEVIVDPLDGGKIDGQANRKIKIDALGNLTFTFTAGQNLGGYQVELRSKQGTSSLSFAVEAAQANL